MTFLLAFLEGIITFLSPCLLPMLPIYLSWFAGGKERTTRRTLLGVGAFVAGFTAVFLVLGTLAGTVGAFLNQHRRAVELLCGAAMIAFGLSYMGLFQLKIFRTGGPGPRTVTGPASAFVFGAVFSLSWTPCVGAFLGSALMLASQQGSALRGTLMLLCYSAGLGIPFLLSALLIDQLKSTLDWIKAHYDAVNRFCGGLLVLVGVAMATGTLGRLLTALS